jgi:hypothetical protein
MFYGKEMLHICGYTIKCFPCFKTFLWLNYVKSPFIKEKYESWKECNTWESFHVCESFTKIFEIKNKNEYINDFYLNLLMVSVWLNMSNTIGYLHRTLTTRHNLWPDIIDLGRIWPTLVGMLWKMILFWWLRATPILVDHETGCIEKLISLVFHAYE